MKSPDSWSAVHVVASLRGSLSADVVEALIGAIYIDKGYAKAREFTEWLMDDAAKMRAAVLDLNFKVLACESALRVSGLNHPDSTQPANCLMVWGSKADPIRCLQQPGSSFKAAVLDPCWT